MADIVVERQTVISFPDSNIPDITEGIMEGSLHVSEILLSKHIAFGEINSNMFEVELQYDGDLSGKKIYVYQNIGTDVIPIFTGYVQSSRLDDYGEYRKVIAYDWFYKNGSQDVTAWWNAFWSNNESSTLGVLLRNFLLYFSIPYIDKTLLNDNMSVTNTQEFASIRLEDMLSLLCEANLCNPNFNRSGYLEFVTVYSATEKSVVDNYEWNNSKFEDYEIANIGLVQIYGSDGHIAASAGGGTNCLKIKDNPFFYDKDTAELNTLATTIYNTVHPLQYMPADIKLILSDLSIKIGDLVRSSKGVSLVCETDLSGPLLIEETLRSVGEEVVAEADSYNPTESRVQNVQKQTTQNSNSLAVITSQVQDLFTKISNKYLLPFGIVLDEVTDIDEGGTPNNVLMFRLTASATQVNSLTVHAELNFNVHTFEKEIDNIDCFQDAIVTVAILLDTNTKLVEFVEYMRDGWKTLLVDYLIGSMPSGTHDVYVSIKSQGASLYSMKVVSGYIDIAGSGDEEPSPFYDINDMRIWSQTVANFMVDNYTDEINNLTIQTQSNPNVYEYAFIGLDVDPFGEYRLTFDIKVDTDYSSGNRPSECSVTCQIARINPTSSHAEMDDTVRLAKSDEFSHTITNDYTSYSLTYVSHDLDEEDTYYAPLETYNVIMFCFDGIAENSTVRFKIKNIKFIKTNSDLQYIDFQQGLWVWTVDSQSRYKDQHQLATDLDAIIVRAVGYPPYYRKNRIFWAVISAEEIDTYASMGKSNIWLANILLSNGRSVYVYGGDTTGQPYTVTQGDDKVYYSTTYQDTNADTISGSFDLYYRLSGLAQPELLMSHELDAYLCERWGEPT